MTVVARPGAPETAGGGIRAKGVPGRLDLSESGEGDTCHRRFWAEALQADWCP